jgi:fructuronate reductase
MKRLSRATLEGLPEPVQRPDFDPTRLRTGIVHLGIGAFARAHLAAYTQKLLADDPSWGICGVSLRHADTRDALEPQNWLYCRAERDGAGERLEVIAALTGVVVGVQAAVERLVDPAVRVVTLTVTEKGYSGDAPNLLAVALHRRWASHLAPFTVLSCDNLPNNGATIRVAVMRCAEQLDPAFGKFVAEQVAFPSCMVDSIVPATTAQDRERINSALEVHDAWPVVCEPFRQWVIEDHFPQGRPAWELAGAELVTDVRPYEDMKLRLLNGSHSSIAYLGQLAGWQTVAEAIAVPELRAHIAALMSEVATTLTLPQTVDLDGYRDALMTRFANPALQHRTAQIAMDGSQKLPPRLFAPALARLAASERAPRIALGVAAWLRFLQGRADDGSPLALDDPHAEQLRATALSDPLAVFGLHDIVPQTLLPLRDEVAAALTSLTALGVKQTLRSIGANRLCSD